MKACWCWSLFAIFLAGCGTKQNPAATCTDNGMCTDPAFPYCDGTFTPAASAIVVADTTNGTMLTD